MSGNDKHDHHVLGGHKGVLNNPNSTEDAKKHSKEILKQAGVDVKQTDGVYTFEQHKALESKHDTRSDKSHAHDDHSSHSHASKKKEEAHGHTETARGGKEEEGDQHDHRVLGGYKATLANENTSIEAKEHAREKLREAGEDY